MYSFSFIYKCVGTREVEKELVRPRDKASKEKGGTDEFGRVNTARGGRIGSSYLCASGIAGIRRPLVL